MRRLRQSLGLSTIVALLAVGCVGNFDTTREARPYADKATLGQEVFGVLCDRVGAGALAEDPSGGSFRAVCHPTVDGLYADAVDQSKLPPVAGVAAVGRNLAVAKVEALARRRSEVVRAIDVILPDIEINDPYGPKDTNGNVIPTKVRLHYAVKSLIQRLNPLYDSNPLASEGASADPLLPSATQSLARLFQALIDSSSAQGALSQIGGRKGYRPLTVGLGALKPALLYPGLRSISQQSVRMLKPGGPARTEFVQLLNVVHQELRTADVEASAGALIIDDPTGIDQPQRPRDNLEILQNVLLATDDAFAGDATRAGLIVLRDSRGFANVVGNSPGYAGLLSEPFTDGDGDGLADIDGFGRFVGADGKPVQVDLPFALPNEPRIRPPDAMGRAVLENGDAAYEYVDTNQTLVAALMRDLGPLVDPDPANSHETLLDALSGAYVLFGDRTTDKQTWVYGDGGKFPKEKLTFSGFNPDTSPMVELVYAAGQVLADPQSDDYLQQMIDLLENHEQDMARVIGNALKLKQISDGYPEVSVPSESTIWDEMAGLVSKMSAVGPTPAQTYDASLLEDVLVALGDDRSLQLGPAYSKFVSYRDVINYDPNDVNGPPQNRSEPNPLEPHLLVDRTKPIRGDNRSAMMRSLQMIYDSTGTKACNKEGAHVHLKAGVLGLTLDVTYPDDFIFDVACMTTKQDVVAECSVFSIADLTRFYLQSLIEDDPDLPAERNRGVARFVIQDECLNSMGGLTDMDTAFEDSSTLTGLTTHPTHKALNRLVFFGADTPNYAMPDLDPTRLTNNKTMADFIEGLQDPIGSRVCAKNATGVNLCTSVDDLLRVRNPGTLFLWEHFGFADANRPVLGAFYDHEREDLFAEMIDVLHRHWADETHGPECSKTGSWDPKATDYNRKWCSEDGVVRYEPMLAQQFKGDLIPSLHDLVKILQTQTIKSKRYRAANSFPSVERRGIEVMASMTRTLFDEQTSAQNQIKNGRGSDVASTVWSDGKTVKKQVTPYDLFANALRKIDDRFDTAAGFSPEERAARKKRWKSARSQLVDQFLSIEDAGKSAHFRNPAAPKAIVRLLKTLREQLNARCPDREKPGGTCDWARHELADKLATSMSGPLFAAIVDLTDKLQADPSRVELEKLVQYLLTVVTDDANLRAVLASAVDVIQVLRDGKTSPPIMNVLASLSVPDNTKGPDGTSSASGAADIVLQVLNVLSRDPVAEGSPDDPLVFDRYRVLDHILPNLVKPIDATGSSETALEVLMDVAADVSRYDSSKETEPLSPDDYRYIGTAARDFLVSPNRGMEQLYTVVRGREGN